MMLVFNYPVRINCARWKPCGLRWHNKYGVLTLLGVIELNERSIVIIRRSNLN